MIITISGEHGSGKSSMAAKLAEKFKLKHYSTGDIFRELARKKGLALADFLELLKVDSKVDNEVDEYVKTLGKEGDDFVIDSRLAWHFIPNSKKIYLSVDEEEGAKRALGDQRGGYRDDEYSNVESAQDFIKKSGIRKKADRKRYKEYYGIENIDDKSNYDLFLDTTHLNKQEVFEKLEEFVMSSS